MSRATGQQEPHSEDKGKPLSAKVLCTNLLPELINQLLVTRERRGILGSLCIGAIDLLVEGGC